MTTIDDRGIDDEYHGWPFKVYNCGKVQVGTAAKGQSFDLDRSATRCRDAVREDRVRKNL